MRANDKLPGLAKLRSVNGLDPEQVKKRPKFSDLTPIYPNEPLKMEPVSYTHLSELGSAGVVIHGDERVRGVAFAGEFVDATEEDWGREYLALEISVRVVSGIDAVSYTHLDVYKRQPLRSACLRSGFCGCRTRPSRIRGNGLVAHKERRNMAEHDVENGGADEGMEMFLSLIHI